MEEQQSDIIRADAIGRPRSEQGFAETEQDVGCRLALYTSENLGCDWGWSGARLDAANVT